MITNLLKKQLLSGMSCENDITDVSTGYVYTKEDLCVSSDLIYEILSKRGFKRDSLLFRHRVEELFGFGIDTLPMQIKFGSPFSNEYDFSTNGIFFFSKKTGDQMGNRKTKPTRTGFIRKIIPNSG